MADRIEAAFASLAKAWPVLAKHADHIDGEFANALDTLRAEVAVMRDHVCPMPLGVPRAAPSPSPAGAARTGEDDHDRGASPERYWCGCVRHARWERCADHMDLDHDDEPPRQTPTPPAPGHPDAALPSDHAPEAR